MQYQFTISKSNNHKQREIRTNNNLGKKVYGIFFSQKHWSRLASGRTVMLMAVIDKQGGLKTLKEAELCNLSVWILSFGQAVIYRWNGNISALIWYYPQMCPWPPQNPKMTHDWCVRWCHKVKMAAQVAGKAVCWKRQFVWWQISKEATSIYQSGSRNLS